MKKKLNRIIEIPCEESEKEAIISRIKDCLVDNEDYVNGYISVRGNRSECVDVIIYEGCSNVSEIVKIVTM